jgi:NADPH:quinone reductase-like Zn-dependent oxidoreductase
MKPGKKPRRRGWKRITALVVLLVPIVGFTILWFDEPEPLANLASGETMRAFVHRSYGEADVLRLETVDKLLPLDNQILVQVRAAAANPLDWHYLRGTPYVMRLESGLPRPHNPRIGTDFAGVVTAVGARISQFKPGDEVFGIAHGAFGEFVLAYERRIALKPRGLSFEQAAAIPIAAVTALQSLRDKGRLAAGQKVLINGASGGVGTFAVQIAHVLGAEVPGVCSTRNIELVRGLGADHVIDYKQEDFTEGVARYDLIVDNVGIHPLSDMLRVLEPQGTLVLVGGGGPDAGNWLGPVARPIKALFMSPFVDQEMSMLLAEVTSADLAYLGGLVESGRIRVVIDRTYPLAEVPEAIRYLEDGRARGKVVIDVAAATGP